jgi:hypothetical protein
MAVIRSARRVRRSGGEANAERLKAYHRAWNRANPEKKRALARHFGGSEPLAEQLIDWSLMRHKSWLDFTVARFHDYDYWLDPLTGELRWEAH